MAPKATPSQNVLNEIPTRVLQFLGAVSQSVPIYTALVERGYNEAEHQKGWDLLLEVARRRQPAPIVCVGRSVESAIAELDAWDEPNFHLVRTALARRHPEQAKFVMADLEASTGMAAVAAVAKLLDRLDELERGVGREATREADHAALLTLAQRGITREERARLRSLVQEAAPATTAIAEPAPHLRSGAERAALLALHAWYEQWSEAARAVIKRREQLFRLGLVPRRRSTGEMAIVSLASVELLGTDHAAAPTKPAGLWGGRRTRRSG